MLTGFLSFLDWFVPSRLKRERSDLSVARFFVFTHIFGPAMAQAMAVMLYLTDPNPGFECWTVIGCIWGFWLFPFALRFVGNLQAVALLSFQLLVFAALFGRWQWQAGYRRLCRIALLTIRWKPLTSHHRCAA